MMDNYTPETAFETYAEEVLLGLSGWTKGTNAGWENQHALVPHRMSAFLQVAKPELWDEMQELHVEPSDNFNTEAAD